MLHRAAAPALHGLVDGYVGYRTTGGPPAVHRGLPTAHMTFMVSIGDPIDVVQQTNTAQAPERYRAVLSGLQATPALIAHDGDQEGVSVRLSPLGCMALLGLPAAELWDLSTELSTVVGPPGDELWERVQAATSWAARFAACDRVLTRWLRQVEGAGPVAGAWRDIVASGGRLTVDQVAYRVGYSRQHLTRLFRRELGLGPKLASRVVRLDRAVTLLRATPRVPLADIALACGYADQAHLCRDVATLAGSTPRELVAGDVPIVQDRPHQPVGAWRHEPDRSHHLAAADVSGRRRGDDVPD